jgi:hypothetical protein
VWPGCVRRCAYHRAHSDGGDIAELYIKAKYGGLAVVTLSLTLPPPGGEDCQVAVVPVLVDDRPSLPELRAGSASGRTDVGGWVLGGVRGRFVNRPTMLWSDGWQMVLRGPQDEPGVRVGRGGRPAGRRGLQDERVLGGARGRPAGRPYDVVEPGQALPQGEPMWAVGTRGGRSSRASGRMGSWWGEEGGS